MLDQMLDSANTLAFVAQILHVLLLPCIFVNLSEIRLFCETETGFFLQIYEGTSQIQRLIISRFIEQKAKAMSA